MDTKIQLRDRVVGQLLGILRPFQVVALDVDDDGELFLHVRCRKDAYKFVALPMADLGVFCGCSM